MLINLNFNASILSSTLGVREQNNTKYLHLISCWTAWNVKILTKHTLWDRSRLECSHWVEAHIMRGRLLLKVRSRRTADSASNTSIRFCAFIASIETQLFCEASWCSCEIIMWSFFWRYMHYNHCHRATAHLQLNILLLLLLLFFFFFFLIYRK